MEEQLGSLAWSIISDVHSHIKSQTSDEPRLLTEATRLAALNMTLRSRLSLDDYFLNALSFEGDRLGVSKKRVHDLVKQSTVQSLVPEDKLQRLPLSNFVNLLGWIHSLGSYRLPSSLNHGSYQRSLGAYYTPLEVADYIVNLTMKEEFNKRIQEITKGGLESFKDFISQSVLDPACGAGVFLISTSNLLFTSTLKAVETARAASIPQSDIDDALKSKQPSLYGVDLDLGALEVADISLRILEGNVTGSIPAQKIGRSLKKGNSLISLNGLHGGSNHQHFFQNPSSMNAFEWSSEFPEIFSSSRGGFDFIIMNPPYERLKPNLAEFLRERLASGDRKIHTDIYDDHKRRIRESTSYFRESNEYHLATNYSLNTYQLFIERALQLARREGNIGCIVPSNILGDVSAQRLRASLLQQNSLRTIDDFPETSRMFPGVTQSVSIITIKKGGQTDSIQAGFNRLSLDDALKKKRMKIQQDRISRTMGSTLTIPRIGASGFKLLDLLHNNPPLGSLEKVLIRRGELDLTNNKNAITPNITNTPLVRGSHISRYALVERRHKSEFVKMSKFKKSLETSSRSEHINMDRIACQQVSNMGQRWRLKFARVESGSVLANSCNYIIVNGKNKSTDLDYYLGILNSELLNWRFQISNFNNHVSIRELQNLPIVRPQENGKIAANLRRAVKKSDYADIEANVFLLYGFSVKQAKSILEFRKTPEEEKTAILQTLSHLIQ